VDEAMLARLRGDLEEQRENLRKEILDQGGNPDSDDVEIDVERNFADSAHSTVERSRVISVVKALRANLRWVDRALSKIQRGSYGDCERCGQPIGIERLEALPWAILCIDCKQAGERG
jgi:RNA polymerase-binding transcription factor